MKPSTSEKALAKLQSPREEFNNSNTSLAPKRPKGLGPKPKSNLPAYFLNQAERAIREHPGCPPGWKRNIRPFLLNCLKEIPYVSSWHWAIHALKSWCRSAPFKYFRQVLRDPNRFKLSGDAVTKFHDVEMYRWLVNAKGRKIANAYAKRKLMWNSQIIYLTDQRSHRVTRIDLSMYPKAQPGQETDPMKLDVRTLMKTDVRTLMELENQRTLSNIWSGSGEEQKLSELATLYQLRIEVPGSRRVVIPPSPI